MDVAITGPIAYRQFVLEKVCEESHGHKHNYDHTTMVHAGRIRVTTHEEVDGVLVERLSREYESGEFVSIPANLHHTIKALAPNTVYYCIFSHRDFGGLVTQKYVGNAAANN